jgi:hypothetical protein
MVAKEKKDGVKIIVPKADRQLEDVDFWCFEIVWQIKRQIRRR